MSVTELMRTGWKLTPFLHVDPARIYNPLTDRGLAAGDEGYASVRVFLEGGPADDALVSDGWIVRETADLSAMYRLKIVSLEMMTACNQKCYFCPVSIPPRDDYTMPEDLFERIIAELVPFGPTLDAVV